MSRTATRPPAYLSVADTFYGAAFGHRKPKDLARSMAEWAEMDDDEQSFAVAHLTYLNLHAQAATQRVLGQLRDVLEDVADLLAAAVEGEETEEELEDDIEDAFEVDEIASEDDGEHGFEVDEAPVHEVEVGVEVEDAPEADEPGDLAEAIEGEAVEPDAGVVEDAGGEQ